MNKVCISLKNFVNSFQKIKHRRRKKIILGEEKRLGNFDFKNDLENECFGSKLNLSNEKIGKQFREGWFNHFYPKVNAKA